MVYYYTSKNVKLIRSLMLNYQTLDETSPHEYMKTYFENSQDKDDSKISWVIESFLGIHKHSGFINKVAIKLAGELSKEDKDYFTIILHAIIFKLSPNDMSSLYKCMYNLSKVLLNTFTSILSNIKKLPLITQIAETEYDKTFVIDSINRPLFSWQPLISEMYQTYKDYVNKIESSKIKMPTKPINMNVLNRTGKPKPDDINHNSENISDTYLDIIPDKRSKMLTNNKINKKLNGIREKNKLKALNLYTIVKNNKCHYTQEICTKKKTYAGEGDIKINHKKIITPMKKSDSLPQIKSTTATIKRIGDRIKEYEKGEIKWLQDIMGGAGDKSKLEELIKYDREEKERQRLFEIERKHLMGQISYEEAIIAKKNLIRENKIKCEELLKEKKLWEKKIEEWKLKEIENNRKNIEKLSLIELDVINARNNATLKRKEMAEKIRQDAKEIKQNILKNKQAELERRVDMIKEIKILSMIAKKSRIPKIIDLTETSGLGLLCEMSIAELQERLAAMKIGLKEELDDRRNKIKTSNLERKQELEETKKTIDDYMSEKAKLRKEAKCKNKIDVSPTSENICQLKKLLMERRNQRMMLTK